ncbi:MAG: dihydroorotase [Planctomycetota bacterium]
MNETRDSEFKIIAGGDVYRSGRFDRSDILIKNDRIIQIGLDISAPGAVSIDARECLVLPGLLDCHVHFREPGLERKEGWETGSRGALHGGVTTVLEIQNNPPLTIDLERQLERFEIVKKSSRVDFGLFPNLLPESAPHLAAMAPRAPGFKLFMGGSTGVGGTTDYGLLRDLFSAAAVAGRQIVVHAEDESLLRRGAAKYNSTNATFHHLARSTEAETLAISAAIELAAATGAALHVFHISTGRGADLVAQAKASNLNVSGSTSPHYLLLTHEYSEKIGNLLKVNPSIKTAKDRDRLCERLSDGTIEAIGTDHAPHPLDEKMRSYAEAPSGLPTVDLVTPLLFEITKRGVPLARLVDSMSCDAARIFGILQKGRIEPGYDADLTIVNPRESRIVQGSALPSKSRWSPYEGFEMNGFPKTVLRRGKVAFENVSLPNSNFLNITNGEPVILQIPEPHGDAATL